MFSLEQQPCTQHYNKLDSRIRDWTTVNSQNIKNGTWHISWRPEVVCDHCESERDIGKRDRIRPDQTLTASALYLPRPPRIKIERKNAKAPVNSILRKTGIVFTPKTTMFISCLSSLSNSYSAKREYCDISPESFLQKSSKISCLFWLWLVREQHRLSHWSHLPTFMLPSANASFWHFQRFSWPRTKLTVETNRRRIENSIFF